MGSDPTDMLTPADVAKALNVSVETVRKMCVKGKLAAVEVGVGSDRHARRIPRGELADYLSRARAERSHQQVRAVNQQLAAARAMPVEEFW